MPHLFVMNFRSWYIDLMHLKSSFESLNCSGYASPPTHIPEVPPDYAAVVQRIQHARNESQTCCDFIAKVLHPLGVQL